MRRNGVSQSTEVIDSIASSSCRKRFVCRVLTAAQTEEQNSVGGAIGRQRN